MSRPTFDSQSTASITECDFCDEFSGGLRNSFATRYQDELRSRIVMATDNFKVLPSLGQIVEGYLLVVPVRHYRALADMPVRLIRELSRLSALVREALGRSCGRVVMFEHGTRTSHAGGCGIHHAHLHLVPLVQGSDPLDLLKKSHSYLKIRSLEDIKHTTGSSSYLYYQSTSLQQYIFVVEHLPSQYMRQILARAVGSDMWDWRQHGREDALVWTVDRVCEVLRQPSPVCRRDGHSGDWRDLT